MAKQSLWIRQWNIPGTDDNTWKVSLKHDGTYACSCPMWKFAKAPKPDCKHIQLVQADPSNADGKTLPSKRIVLANVREVTPRGTSELLTPLVPIGDAHFSFTVACDLARLGASATDIKRYLGRNSLLLARQFVAEHGRKIYGPWSADFRRHEGFSIVPIPLSP